MMLRLLGFLFIGVCWCSADVSRFKRAIAGGHVVTSREKHPAAVFLLFSDDPEHENVMQCSGSLIGARYVLTAAHCAYQLHHILALVNEIDATVGIKYHFGEDVDESVRKHVANVSSVVVHPDYNSEKNYHDIAVIKLDKMFAVSNMMKLYGDSEITDDKFLAMGYGNSVDLDETGKRMEPENDQKLRVVEVPILDNARCTYTNFDCKPDVCICAGTTNKGILAGDSGGPLYIKQYGEFYQVGVTSAGDDADVESIEHKDIYMKVPKYCDFIEKSTDHEVRCVKVANSS